MQLLITLVSFEVRTVLNELAFICFGLLTDGAIGIAMVKINEKKEIEQK